MSPTFLETRVMFKPYISKNLAKSQTGFLKSQVTHRKVSIKGNGNFIRNIQRYKIIIFIIIINKLSFSIFNFHS